MSYIFRYLAGVISNKKIAFIFFNALVFFSSCNSDHKPLDTPTSGAIKIAVDESFLPLMDQMIDTFESLYKRAKINVDYKPEVEVINNLMNDSVKLIVTCKELSEEQMNYIKAKKILLRKTKVAVDAVALIVNPENKNAGLKLSQVSDMINGKITDWKQISNDNTSGEIRIVFDNAGSANTRFLREKFLKAENFPSTCSAVKSNAEVINYVSSSKNTIGVIAVNWVSDMDDPASNSFMQKVKVVELQDDINTQDLNYYGPYQAYISLNNYPLTREVYVMTRESRTGLGTGFASFVAGDKGQRIVRLAGLLPATMPVRLIQLK